MALVSSSRGGQPYGKPLEATENDIAPQGAVMADADYDIDARLQIVQDNHNVAPSMYGSVDTQQVWNIDPYDPLFSVPSMSGGGSDDTQLKVLPCLNGLGVQASLLYPDDPEMVRLAVKNMVRFQGMPFQYLSAAAGNAERGIAVQMAGLKTVRVGNGAYGEDSDAHSTDIRPGDTLCVDVPTPGPLGLQPGPGARSHDGVPPVKYQLQVRRLDPRSAGQALVRHIWEVTTNPAKWQRAMGKHVLGTSAWMSAVRNIVQSYNAYLALGVGVLIEQDYLAPGANLAGIVGALGQNVPEHIIDAAAVARALGVIGNAPVEALRIAVIKTGFNRPGNLAHEFGRTGAAGGPIDSVARYFGVDNNAGKIKDGPLGDLLREQMNHLPRAAAAFHTAIQADRALVIGTATSGGSHAGSGKVNVLLAKNAV